MSLLLALPKGRLGEELIRRLEGTPLALDPRALAERALRVPTASPEVIAILLKGADLPRYVAAGVAALGVVGSDTLDEQEVDLLELADLNFGSCRLSLCAPEGIDLPALRQRPHLKLATKFAKATAHWLDREGLVAEIVPIESSVELAPLLGLADATVDLVQTGATLRAHGLHEVHPIGRTSARLIASRSAQLARPEVIARVVKLLQRCLGDSRSG